jgi:hypothetical protein
MAAARADAVVIVSTPAKLKAAVHAARTTGGESYPEILAFSVKPAQPAFQEAA